MMKNTQNQPNEQKQKNKKGDNMNEEELEQKVNNDIDAINLSKEMQEELSNGKEINEND